MGWGSTGLRNPNCAQGISSAHVISDRTKKATPLKGHERPQSLVPSTHLVAVEQLLQTVAQLLGHHLVAVGDKAVKGGVDVHLGRVVGRAGA